MLQNMNVHWPKFVTGIVLSTVLSLSVHAVMLQQMHIPFPDLSVITTPYKFIIRVLSVLGLQYFWELAKNKVPASLAKQWLLLFLIDAMLTESLFRGPFMDGYCTRSVGFMFINNIPKLLAIAVTCGLIIVTAPIQRNTLAKILTATGIAAVFMFAASPLLQAAWKPVMDRVAYLAPTGEWCTLPYGPDVLIPAYISFLEPVVACLAMAVLILNQLSKKAWLKFALFVLIVLAVKYQLTMPLFYAALHKGNFFSNLASEGQFALETIALAITTGFTWQWSSDKTIPKSN